MLPAIDDRKGPGGLSPHRFQAVQGHNLMDSLSEAVDVGGSLDLSWHSSLLLPRLRLQSCAVSRAISCCLLVGEGRDHRTRSQCV
eukprot:591625-Hanusia_phi.AAC.2